LIWHSVFKDFDVVYRVITKITIAAIRIGISKFVRNPMEVAPILPKVEITANPIGPQLQAPAIDPTKEPKTLPPIFFLEFFKRLIR